MPKNHAILAPSAAARWINCPGSVKLSEQVPTPPSSSYADEGTLAHHVAEMKLRRLIYDHTEVFDASLAEARKDERFDGEMEEATDLYRDLVSEKLGAAGPDALLLIEQHFSLNEWAPGSFGTSDAVIISEGVIEVIDLKYGKGIRVDAQENPQLRLYGLGAAGLFEDVYDFDTVRMTIIQPRLNHISTEEVFLEDLQNWGLTVVQPAAVEALDPEIDDADRKIAAGDWCRWCPAKDTCRARAEKNLELAKYDFRMPPLLSNDEVGEILAKAEELQKWTADLQAWALQAALNGEKIDGWKLVEGRSVRKYADELKVAEVLKAAGYDEPLLYERKLNGLTAMEKLVGKKKLGELLGDLIVKPAGKPTLVPASDKRPELVMDAAKDFEEDLPFC